jgi:hypothetical protein
MAGPNCTTRWNWTTANHVIFIGLWRGAFIELWRIANLRVAMQVILCELWRGIFANVWRVAFLRFLPIFESELVP